MTEHQKEQAGFREKLYEIIFGYESRAGKLFDEVLISVIFLSVLAVMLNSVASINEQYGELLYVLEWIFTILFTIEYVLRLYSSGFSRTYVLSFFGLVDLLSILPTYIAFLLPGAEYLIIVRILRVLRIFRILKLMRYVGEADILLSSLVRARHKIFVFLYCILTLVVIFGCLMFLVEGPENGFMNIPSSIYWTIVTITTVGYGDITPHTILGQFISSMMMITGYAIIAVPFGIVSSELITEFQKRQHPEKNLETICPNCNRIGHDLDAHYCKQCGSLIKIKKVEEE